MLRARDVMTPNPHTIGAEQPLSMATDRMREHHVRHLPVLHGGELLGVLSERDVGLVSAIPDIAVESLRVEDAMTVEPYAVSPDTPLVDVARSMHRHRYGSAMVQEAGRVVGIITTVDVLDALVKVLDA
jgi:acetoin utilization protein AcuB